jgi:ubiquinone/menaquinone biosynthesis C-methylase UbiE
MSKTEHYEQTGVVMTCRSYEEYVQMFMLDEHLLKKGKVLDVASGGSSFVAELNKRGHNAIGVDPLYRLPVEEMSTHGDTEIAIANQKLDKVKHLYVWDSYGSLDTHNEIRLNSFKQFLNSYEKDAKKEKYIAATLPSLPFEDETFSLILCNHFLFLYQDQFDYQFHLDAIKELIRITKKDGVIRIYPLVGFKNEVFPYINQLMATLDNDGIKIELSKTDFRFLPSATHFLSIKK